MITELQKAKDLMDKEQYELAINILNNLKDLPLKSENFRLLFLSNCLYNIEEYYLAIDTADKLLQKDHKNEYASQIKYLSYYELEDYDNALNEVIGFLSNNEANLYKVTLEELLIDIKEGFINEKDTVYKIKELALQNNINP
jgi:tetratricopeptide (TPR) repeat protein